MLRSVHGDRDRYESTYFTPYPGYYCAGESARRDADVLNVSGHRIGTSEVEAALSTLAAVAEAAVIGVTHAVKGQGIRAFVVLNDVARPSAALRRKLVVYALRGLFADVLVM
jgi:acetyl-CoA synthetase